MSPYRMSKSKPAVDPCTPCPACGGLECLCRPRFFAGQLLSEEDLNRLDHYIVGKGKLRNRYLHGWGVACGLEAACHPCGNMVLVHPGYALSACGDDIVVCREETVDVCKLIAACCTPEPDECDPPRQRPPGCDDLEQKWVLAICYRETPSRGITAIKGPAEPCCSKCAGGGSACGCGGKKSGARACGCSCHEKAPASTFAPRRTPPQCEPTVLCEGYYFKLYLAPKRDPKEDATGGAMLDRFLACLKEVNDAVPNPPAPTASLEQIRQWCCDVRDSLLDLFARHPGTECALLERIAQLCPAPPAGTPPSAYLNQVSAELEKITAQFFRHCFCSSLLPPCPGPVTDPCVPLATLTIRKKDCQILRICNLENRKFLATIPNLAYWLSFLPFVRELRARLEEVCCEPPREAPAVGVQPGFANIAAHVQRRNRTPLDQTRNFAGAVADAFSRESPLSVFDALAFDALGLHDAAGNSFAPDAVAANPLHAIVARQFLAPLVRDTVPAGVASLISGTGGLDAARLAAENKRRDNLVAELRGQLETLQNTIRAQQITIEGLIRRIG